jgi:hypothetical protein
MSWNIQKPGDYINGPLTVVGAATFNSQVTVNSTVQITGGVSGQGALIGRDGSSGGATYGSSVGSTNINSPASGSIRFNVNNGTLAGLFDVNGNLGVSVPLTAFPYKINAGGIIAAVDPSFAGGGGSLIGALLNNDNVSPGLDLRRWTGTAGTHGVAYLGVEASGMVRLYNHQQASNTKATQNTLSIDANGNLTANIGNIGFGTANKGIDFSVNSNAAGATSELLNDYEEGTWTGTIGGTTGNPTTPVTSTGRYTKIGRQVSIEIGFYGDTTGASSRITVSGLPFTSNVSIARPGAILMDTMGTFTGSPIAFLGSFVTTIELYSSNSNGPISSVTHNAGAGRALYMQLTYTV